MVPSTAERICVEQGERGRQEPPPLRVQDPGVETWRARAREAAAALRAAAAHPSLFARAARAEAAEHPLGLLAG
ncbi:MAG TPA: hypothetical protein VEC15_11650, partial [Actinomycetota bacterium]|nr:hypothetical protein [Actinomycetota bacterium]